MPDTQIKKTFCRICQGYCALDVSISNNKITDIKVDKQDPLSRGFACFKGLQAIEQHHGDGRLKQSLARDENGEFKAIDSELAIQEISEQISTIVAQHGPNSVAIFHGTQSPFQVLGIPMVYAFAKALDTKSMYGTMTIDQSAKWIADGRMGLFSSGAQPFIGADTWMLIGTNPMVSILGGPYFGGFHNHNPVKAMQEAKKLGMKLIVIDPRRTETAKHADIFIQCRAGEDAHILAALINIILNNDWHDAEFCSQFVNGLDELKKAVQSFTPERIAERAGVDSNLLYQAAKVFAKESKTGGAGGGTAPDMGPFSNLAEHLIRAINVICGRYLRAGEDVPNIGVLSPTKKHFAKVIAPNRQWEKGTKTKKFSLGSINGQMMSATLADEILFEGKGGIKALICLGSNPATALPDQPKAMKALQSLDLLVTLDPRMSATAELADYVIAPTLQYERPDHTGPMEGLMRAPYAHYTDALISPTPDMDVIDEWYFFWKLAQHLDLSLTLNGHSLAMDEPLSSEAMLELSVSGSRIPLSTIRQHNRGALYPSETVFSASENQQETRLELMPDDVAQEIKTLLKTLQNNTYLGKPTDKLPGYRLIVRRQRQVMNSFMTDFESVKARFPYPPAFMHPDAMQAFNLNDGDDIKLITEHDTLIAHAKADPTLRDDTISMTHCWTSHKKEEKQQFSTSKLTASEKHVEAINRMPVMTGIPVTIEKA